MDAFKVKGIKLAKVGQKRIKQALDEMPGFANLVKEMAPSQPLHGARIAGCLHITSETAVLVDALVQLGATVRWCSSNPYSTQDDIAAAMAESTIPVFAWYGQTNTEYEWCLARVLNCSEDQQPNMILDDGAELTSYLHKYHPYLVDGIQGITEETTSGLLKLKKLAKNNTLQSPAIVINNSITKSKFDNIYGCGESLIAGIRNSMEFMICGKTVTVVGYGYVGKGCVKVLRSLGAIVQVIEIDPIAGLQALVDGCKVVTMEEACKNTHLFVTATGNINVISLEAMQTMMDNVVLCNMGNFNNEIDIESLSAFPSVVVSPKLTEFKLTSGKTIKVLGNGALVNLSCASGHANFIMSLTFSNQLLAQVELYTNGKSYRTGINTLPRILDEKIAKVHLKHLGGKLTRLTTEQAEYSSKNINGPYQEDWYRY